MMIEDKLTQDQRLRLECLAQAVNHSASRIDGRTPENTIRSAKLFEEYVRGICSRV